MPIIGTVSISTREQKVMEKVNLIMENDLDLSEESLSDTEIDDEDLYVSKKNNPLLQQDIELLQSVFPQSCLSARMLPGLCEMDLKISFPTDHLNEFIMKAWGLTPGLPITLHLTLDSELYLSSDAKFIVEVFQANSALKTGATVQLKNIAQAFCFKQRHTLSNEMASQSLKTCKENSNRSRPKSHSGAEFSENFSLENGFLVRLYIYMQERLMTLNNYCPICDQPHPCSKENVMLKMVVCNNPLCIFSSQTLGVMTDVTPLLRTQPEVAQLLIHLTAAAIQSERQELILSPFPTIVHSEKVTELVLDPKKDSDLLKTVIKLIPNVKDLGHISEGSLKENLSRLNSLCYPLLRWIISSNRSHIELIPVEKQLQFMKTDYQFLLLSRPPVENNLFITLKMKYGSVFAFHGSPIDNWHSIIREGIIVASGTKRQLNGAAYGMGIYLSPHLSTSMNYSSRIFGLPLAHPSVAVKSVQNEQKKPMEQDLFTCDSTNLICIALCEVINDSSLKKHNRDVWTCENCENVCTRFFFVYKARVKEYNIDVTNAEYEKQVRMALSLISK